MEHGDVNLRRTRKFLNRVESLNPTYNAAAMGRAGGVKGRRQEERRGRKMDRGRGKGNRGEGS